MAFRARNFDTFFTVEYKVGETELQWFFANEEEALTFASSFLAVIYKADKLEEE